MPFDRAPTPRTTLFLSDLHLGALSANGDAVLRFLTLHPADCYVLVGDVLDLWHPLLPHWTAQDQAVIDHLNARARAGATIIYVRGNHDPDPTLIPPHARLNATHAARHIHQRSNGQKLLVVHGDEVDHRLIRTHLMTRLGSRIDHGLRRLDARLRRLSREGSGARTLAERVSAGFNALMYHGRDHERRLLAMARVQGLDGVICGHFHIASLHCDLGLTYANCGDWVDSMTALLDPGTGDLRLLGTECLPRSADLACPSSLLNTESAPVP